MPSDDTEFGQFINTLKDIANQIRLTNTKLFEIDSSLRKPIDKPKGLDSFLEELRKQDEAIFASKTSLENKANSIITISGTIAALLFGFGALVIQSIDPQYVYLPHAVGFLMTSIIASSLAIFISVVSLLVRDYCYSLKIGNLIDSSGTPKIDTYISNLREEVIKSFAIDYTKCLSENSKKNEWKAKLVLTAQIIFFIGIAMIPFLIGTIFLNLPPGKSSNLPPVADAGRDEIFLEGAIVRLDGNRSIDADGKIKSYLWEQIAGPEVNLSDYTDMNPTYRAPNVTNNTTQEFRLVVIDDANATGTSTVKMNISNNNSLPIVAPIDESTVIQGQETEIIVRAHDPDGDPLKIFIGKDASHGRVKSLSQSGNLAKMVYQANDSYVGNDSFTVIVDDGKSRVVANVTVDIKPRLTGGPDYRPNHYSMRSYHTIQI